MIYKGLANVGATCYINSLIQTLFMTPEFKDAIYGWTYSEKAHPPRQDSILYQLQKLFGRLQLGCSANTTDLIRSFQWKEDEAFLQQDIQEFNRVLFEAIEKSLALSPPSLSPQQHIIKELYEGQLVHFTKCLQCHCDSAREQGFQDIILVIKNIYERVYSGSLELSLQRYIKPELLDEQNLYDCSQCSSKVRAQRGVKFLRLPRLLNLVLQRFHFDYETLTRNKINDAFAFPLVLNFNHYFNGYDHIPNKLSEDSSAYFLQEEPKKQVFKPRPLKTTVPRVVSKNGTTATQPAVAGKIKTKPSANTKSFLQEMRKKKTQQLNQDDDLIFVSGNHIANQPVAQTSSQLPKEQIMEEDCSSKPATDPLFIPPPPPPPPPFSLPDPVLSVPYSYSSANSSMEQQIISKQSQSGSEQKGKLWQAEQAVCRGLVQQYLLDGPLVYELYSIMVHSGTANAGHYFSYIRSPDNNKWYLFNDERVQEITPQDIQKSFGGSGGIANAYVLYYRLHEEHPFNGENKLPEYIVKAIREEQVLREQKQVQRMKGLQSVLVLKIYLQLAVKTIEINKDSPLSLLLRKSAEMFGVKLVEDLKDISLPGEHTTLLKAENVRLRLYNPANDTKLDTFTGRESESLSQLGVRSYQTLLLEVKADDEEFEEFVAGFMSIRVALWEENPNVLSLDEKSLRLHKVSVGRDWNMRQAEAAITAKRNEILKQNQQDSQESICIIKRHQNDEFLYHQIINLDEYYEKSIDSVGIFEGEVVFVEADGHSLNWPREFQNQIHRITIKVINSATLDSHSLTTDSRITLNTLRNTVCALVQQPPEETIIRRGNKTGLELKNGEASLKENRFISGTTLFLERGLPAKMGQVRIQLFLAREASREPYNRLHEFEFLADVPIDTNLKAGEVKLIFLGILSKVKGLQLQPQVVRIRQKVNDKMGKIYREKPMREQQIIQRREIAIELRQDGLDPREFSIYVRVWDQLNWLLSDTHEFLVGKHTTMKALAAQVHARLTLHQPELAVLPEQMDICRILSIHKFGILDLVDMEYFGMVSEACVLGQPLFVNSDGLLYIIKNTSLQPRPLTKQEEEIFGGKVRTTLKPTRGRVSQQATVNNTKKEKGITIKVVEREGGAGEKQVLKVPQSGIGQLQQQK